MVEREFETDEGVVVISIDEDQDYRTTVRARDEPIEIGRFEFVHLSDDWPARDALKLVWTYLDWAGDRFKREGIGEEILRLVREFSGFPIVAEDDDGQRKSDGSHLTQDAPVFIARMREKGLIAKSSYDEE